MDSVYIGASISNADGVFLLDHQPERYHLIIQHLLYKTKQREGAGKDAGVIVLC